MHGDDVFKIKGRMVKTNQNINGGQCIRNVDGVLSVSDEKLLKRKFAWGGNTLSQEALHKKRSFPLRISSVNVTKSAVSCRFGHIY